MSPRFPNRPVTQTQLRKFVESEQNKNRDALGFLPREAIATYTQHGQIIPATENGQLVSYCVFFDGQPGTRPRRDPYTVRIYQLCTDYDARRLQHATQLVNRLYDHATANRFERIRLWCADDLPANVFWRTLGFEFKGTRLGGAKRDRQHNLWILPLPPKLWTPKGANVVRPVAKLYTAHQTQPSPFRRSRRTT